MTNVEPKVKMIKSLSDEGKRIVAMCEHANSIFVATEHEVFRCKLDGEILKQMTFQVIE